ncbi:MAG: hypothetical protein A3A86_04425 [Elusimicrobia bacterium RIFCSPLOWO2_01_FULL_60_11]|nr:MAG: hypothetical protein A3A86_04425 [Elusimicrobia bacterium RIFCSPLOWO2_01_FULL_60_11]
MVLFLIMLPERSDPITKRSDWTFSRMVLKVSRISSVAESFRRCSVSERRKPRKEFSSSREPMASMR